MFLLLLTFTHYKCIWVFVLFWWWWFVYIGLEQWPIFYPTTVGRGGQGQNPSLPLSQAQQHLFSSGPDVRPKMQIKSDDQDQPSHLKLLEKHANLKPPTQITDGLATLKLHLTSVDQQSKDAPAPAFSFAPWQLSTAQHVANLNCYW